MRRTTALSTRRGKYEHKNSGLTTHDTDIAGTTLVLAPALALHTAAAIRPRSHPGSTLTDVPPRQRHH